MRYTAKHMAKYCALLLIAFATIASAQSFDPIGTGVINQQITATVTPENPTPGQSVTIALSAYGTDLTTAQISWSINGGQTQSGTGKTQFTLAAGKNGETKRVTATITPTNGPTITRSFTVSAQDVAIIYESDGYVPPFYKGKGAYAKEGTVTLVAVPNFVSAGGTRLSPNSLIYTWSVDDTVQGSKSGYGKSSFTYTGDILANEVMVKVEVSSSDKTTNGSSIILLTPQQPELLVYEKNPLYGTLFNSELAANGFSLDSKEVTVAAIPFSTSASRLDDGTLAFIWSINGATIPVPSNQSYATFRNSTGQKGTSVIGISAKNTTHLLQMMQKSLSINF